MSGTSVAGRNLPSRRVTVAALVAVAALAGCGQKGPLTMPQAAMPPAAASAPAR